MKLKQNSLRQSNNLPRFLIYYKGRMVKNGNILPTKIFLLPTIIKMLIDAMREKTYNILTNEKDKNTMDYAVAVKTLRSDMSMTRTEFCEYFQIPYRTVCDWEAGKRKMPAYLLNLMQYKANAENMCKSTMD